MLAAAISLSDICSLGNSENTSRPRAISVPYILPLYIAGRTEAAEYQVLGIDWATIKIGDLGWFC